MHWLRTAQLAVCRALCAVRWIARNAGVDVGERPLLAECRSASLRAGAWLLAAADGGAVAHELEPEEVIVPTRSARSLELLVRRVRYGFRWSILPIRTKLSLENWD